jgi:hypothetical protein
MNKYSRYYRRLKSGERRAPRGLETRGLTNQQIYFPIGTAVRRKGDNVNIGFMEGLQWLAGTFDHDAIARVAPRAKLELFTGQSAYGLRLGKQFERVINELMNDPDSRRAVIMVASPNDALADRPCTLALQFHRETDINHVHWLNATAYMRSSDAIWGLPYDIVQFSVMSLAASHLLTCEPGLLTIMIGDAHIYTDVAESVRHFDDQWWFTMPKFPTLVEYQAWANSLITDEGLIDLTWAFNLQRRGRNDYS